MSDTELAQRRVGTTLQGKWTLEKVLGVGGMASVYAGRHKIGRLDAIKVLHMDVAHSPLLRARFEQEAHVVNKFRHKGAVEIRDIDTTEDGAPFLVMELLSGESLSQLVHRVGALEPERVLRIADETLDVLAAAHAQGIIHRDIKPDNLFIQEDGSVKVLDFGIARLREGSPDRKLKTKTGTTLGTASYMAPEQARGIVEIDGRVDVYAVGATMFRVLTNRRVHEADTQVELLMKLITEPAPKLASVAPGIPAAICAVVDRALAHERNERYPDAKSMQADVRAAMSGKMPAPIPKAPEAPPMTAQPARKEPTVATAVTPAVQPAIAAQPSPAVTVVRDGPPPTLAVPPSAEDLRASAPSARDPQPVPLPPPLVAPNPQPVRRAAIPDISPMLIAMAGLALLLVVGLAVLGFWVATRSAEPAPSSTPAATTGLTAAPTPLPAPQPHSTKPPKHGK